MDYEKLYKDLLEIYNKMSIEDAKIDYLRKRLAKEITEKEHYFKIIYNLRDLLESNLNKTIYIDNLVNEVKNILSTSSQIKLLKIAEILNDEKL